MYLNRSHNPEVQWFSTFSAHENHLAGGLPDLANKNTGHTVQFEGQTNNK